jgi:protein ImuB
VLLEHCRALLERWPLPAPVTGVAIAITATARTAGGQGELLASGRRDDAAAAAAAARLAAALGSDAVVRPAARDAHAPERAGTWVPVGEEEPATAAQRGTFADAGPSRAMTMSERALRLLQPPEAVEVEHAAGIPCAMWWRGARLPLHRVQGPERLSGDWWRDDAYRRDYWRCESETGSFVVFQDHAGRGATELPGPQGPEDGPRGSDSDAWFVHGWYD